MENSINHMTSQRLRGFSDELPDTELQVYKHFPERTVTCLSLRYTDHEHSFVHSESQETVLILLIKRIIYVIAMPFTELFLFVTLAVVNMNIKTLTTFDSIKFIF